MAKLKTTPQLEAEKAENKRKSAQLQHKKQQLENRITYYEKGDRRKRAHHLIPNPHIHFMCPIRPPDEHQIPTDKISIDQSPLWQL